MKAFGAVIFDLDDVLYPQWEYALGGYRAIANYMMTVYGTPLYEELAKRYQAGCTEKLLSDVLSGHFEKVEAEFLHRLIAIYWAHKPQINLFPDARICIAFMRTIDVKTSIVTDGRSDIQRAKVKALDLAQLVDPVLFTADLIGDDKTTESMKMAELLMGVPLEETAYIGNIVASDFRTAQRLGMHTVLVKRPIHLTGKDPNAHEAIESMPEADIIIPSLADLHHVIEAESNAFGKKR